MSLAVPSGFVAEGDSIILLGTTCDEIGGSSTRRGARYRAGRIPRIDLEAERRLIDLLVRAAGARLPGQHTTYLTASRRPPSAAWPGRSAPTRPLRAASHACRPYALQRVRSEGGSQRQALRCRAIAAACTGHGSGDALGSTGGNRLRARPINRRNPDRSRLAGDGASLRGPAVRDEQMPARG